MPGKGNTLIEDMQVNRLETINKSSEDPEVEKDFLRQDSTVTATLPWKIKINNVQPGIED